MTIVRSVVESVRVRATRRARDLGSGRARGAMTVAIANGANNLVAFVGFGIAARLLGPTLFADLGLAMTIILVLTLVLDFGQDVSIVRSYGRAKDPLRQGEIAWRFLQWKFVLVVVVAAVSFPVGALVARYSPMRDGTLVALAIISAALLSVWKTLRAIDQARGAFGALGRHILVYGAGRVIALLVILALGPATSRAFVLGLFVLPLLLLIGTGVRDFGRSHPDTSLGWGLGSAWAEVGKGLAYGKWIAVSAIAFNAFIRLPQVALASRTDLETVGVYSAALTFLGAMILLNDALRTVILPEAARIDTIEERVAFRDRLLGIRIPFFVLGVGAIALLCGAQVVILGEAYRDGIWIFAVLSAALLVSMYLGFFNSLVHSHGRPAFEATVNTGRVAVLAVLLWTLPLSGLGAAVLFGVSLVVGEIVSFVTIRSWDPVRWSAG